MKHDSAETVYISSTKRRSRLMLDDSLEEFATPHDARAYFIVPRVVALQNWQFFFLSKCPRNAALKTRILGVGMDR